MYLGHSRRYLEGVGIHISLTDDAATFRIFLGDLNTHRGLVEASAGVGRHIVGHQASISPPFGFGDKSLGLGLRVQRSMGLRDSRSGVLMVSGRAFKALAPTP